MFEVVSPICAFVCKAVEQRITIHIKDIIFMMFWFEYMRIEFVRIATPD